jgi:hypothetical protein
MEATVALQGWMTQRGYRLNTRESSQIARSTTTGTIDGGVNLQTDTRTSAASYRVEFQHGTTGMTYKVIRLSDGVTMEYFTVFDTGTTHAPSYWIQRAQQLLEQSFIAKGPGITVLPDNEHAGGADTYGDGPTPGPVYKR